MASHPTLGGVGPITAVSAAPGEMDIFTVGNDRFVYWAQRRVKYWNLQPIVTWSSWQRLLDGQAVPGAPVAAVSRSANNIDVFVVGTDGRVWTAWKHGRFSSWGGWHPISANPITVVHATVTAVSRAPDKIDLFLTDRDGRIRSNRWEPGSDWAPFWSYAIGGRAPPGAPIGAVSMWLDRLDLFVVGNSSRVFTTSTKPNGTFNGWRPMSDGIAPPGSPVTAVSRHLASLDVFVVGYSGSVLTSGWHWGDTLSWRSIPGVTVPRRSIVSAVSRAPDRLDLLVTDSAGNVMAAARPPSSPNYNGWWPVASGRALPGAPVGLVSRATNKLDAFVFGNSGRVFTSGWQPGDPAWRRWERLGQLVGGMSDPGIPGWRYKGILYGWENTDHSHEAQGITTDGPNWYFSSNGSKTIRKYDTNFSFLGARYVLGRGLPGDAHVGAPGHYEGFLYVPIQNPMGVFKLREDLLTWQFLPAGTDANLLSWCDVNALNGRLYTTLYNPGPARMLFAYDRNTMARVPDDDIELGPTAIHLDRIQGGVFTVNGRLILSRAYPNAIFCFSAKTGYCFGAQWLTNMDEAEGVTVRLGTVAGSARAEVHVLELNNDIEDDAYVHSFAVPDPARL